MLNIFFFSFLCPLYIRFLIRFVDDKREKYVLDISEGLIHFPDNWKRVTHAIRMISRYICLELHEAAQQMHEGSVRMASVE